MTERNTPPMVRHTVTQVATGVVLFDDLAFNKADALNRMARNAGFADYAAYDRIPHATPRGHRRMADAMTSRHTLGEFHASPHGNHAKISE
jgi:hypothetical protein